LPEDWRRGSNVSGGAAPEDAKPALLVKAVQELKAASDNLQTSNDNRAVSLDRQQIELKAMRLEIGALKTRR
jgi:hypothetical protein